MKTTLEQLDKFACGADSRETAMEVLGDLIHDARLAHELQAALIESQELVETQAKCIEKMAEKGASNEQTAP